MALTDEGIIDTPDLYSRWVRLPGGVKTHYMTAGSSGPNIVLLHGGLNGSSGQAGWRDIAPGLAKAGFRVYAPDLPAFGLTVDETEYYGYGLGAQLNFLRDFVDALCLDTFHLAGNSLGCNIGAHYLVDNPHRVLSFAGIAGAFGDVVPEDAVQRPAKRSKINLDFDGTEAAMRRILENIVLNPEKVSDDLVAMRTRAANAQGDRWDKMMGQFFQDVGHKGDANSSVRYRTKGRLEKLTTPAIYIYGAKDTLNPVEQAYIQEDALPNFQMFYPPNCGHQSQTDDPDLHIRLLSEFFRDGKVTAATAKEAGVSQRRPLGPYVEA